MKGGANTVSPGDPDFDPHKNEPIWVSRYWETSPGSKTFEGGWFLEDYVERTLPHIFSCVRRIPGYLGAPMALTSPYMVVEPFVYKADPNNVVERLSFTETDYNNFQSINLPTLLGSQPKVSVEDLVSRHALPKVSFVNTGFYEIKSIGFVNSSKNQRVAQTTINVNMKAFDVKTYRSQREVVSLVKTGIGQAVDQTHPSINIGPEFKPKVLGDTSNDPNDRVSSKNWLSLGLKDANCQAGAFDDPSDNVPLPSGVGDDSVQGWDLFMVGDPLAHDGGLGQSTVVTTFLPDYGTTEWKQLYDPSLNQQPVFIGDNLAPLLAWPHASLPNLTKTQARKRGPFGSTFLQASTMEGTDKHLWSQKDSHDLDPFGQGIFFSHSGNGEYADKDMANATYHVYPSNHPNTFNDNMYWNLNHKLKSWGMLTSHPHAKDAEGKYVFAPDIRDPSSSGIGPFTGSDEVNPVGLSFHRSFFSAWFRIPTAYPFPHPVAWGNTVEAPNEINNLSNKRHFHKAIMSLQFRPTDEWVANRPISVSDHHYGSWPNSDYGFNIKRQSGGREYVIEVGYYSGFDDSFNYDHGVKGYMNVQRYMGGTDSVKPTSTKWAFQNSKHPLYFAPKTRYTNYAQTTKHYSLFDYADDPSSNEAKEGDRLYKLHQGFPTRGLNPYYGKSHGYFWDYDHLVPTPFTFDNYVNPGPLANPSWGGGNADLGYLWQWGDVISTVDAWIPQAFIGWKQDYANNLVLYPFGESSVPNIYSTLFYRGFETDTDSRIYGFFPQNNILYMSHCSTRPYGYHIGQRITHKLRMNNTPECAPGSWHRIYAFWFLRFNPGQMGLTTIHGVEGHHDEMGDSEKYGGSYWWDERNYATYHKLDPSSMFCRVDELVPGGYPVKPTTTDTTSLYLPHGGSGGVGLNTGMIQGFPTVEEPVTPTERGMLTSRYAKDDAKIGAQTNTDAAYDVDGLDQFGIWFRDDSNYTQWCSGAANAIYIKPRWEYAQSFDLFTNDFSKSTGSIWATDMEGCVLSIGETQVRRQITYYPASRDDAGVDKINDVYNPRFGVSWHMAEVDYAWRHYPAYRFGSSIDDVIFGYGADISIPEQSYFRGLFHNANWLAKSYPDQNDQYNRHPDEVRYDVREEPRINLELYSSTSSYNEIDLNSLLLHVDSRIYTPRDDNYNYSDVEVNVFKNNVIITPALTTHNNQSHFYEANHVVSGDFRCQFQYRNRKPNRWGSGADLDIQSTIYNYNQDYGSGIYTFDNGDSFTNIPYIQELTIRYKDLSHPTVLSWKE